MVDSAQDFDRIRLQTAQTSEKLIAVDQRGENSGEICSTAEDNGLNAEKTMPCGMRYSEPFKTRPNFFIPLMSVGSYVLPFVILMLLNAIFQVIPGIPEFRKELKDLDQGWRVSDQLYAFFAFLFLSAPMGIGVLTASLLNNLTKLRSKTKLITWLAVIFSVCAIECLILALTRYVFHDTYGLR